MPTTTPAVPADLPRCPFAHGRPYDPLTVAAAEDPQPWLSAARASAPVFHHEPLDLYVVTRHADILAVLRDPATFSSRYANKFKPMDSPALRAAFPHGHPGLRAMTLTDPPAHSRIRRLANVALTPAAVARTEPAMRHRCARLVDGFAADGEADLMARYSSPITVLMITDLAGLPESLDVDLHQWAQDYFAMTLGAPPLTEPAERAIADRAVRMTAFLTDFVEQRRDTPRDDLVSALLAARTPEGDAALTTVEVIAVLNSLLVAGVETTAVFVPMLLRELLRHPEQWAALRADPALLPFVIEEGLRRLSTARGVRRTATRDTEIAGVPIPAGKDVFLTYASANHDEAVFAEPDRFDIRRARADRHLSFGKGIHYCIGAPLARLQSSVAVRTVLDRLPGLRLVDREIEWLPHMTLPRPVRVRFAWDPVPVPAPAGGMPR
ncbi:MAG TPA: cytochrome P450 [Pseudonocardia sp.]|nr:cytochrome P450 [Pseudonocardia sp.]